MNPVPRDTIPPPTRPQPLLAASAGPSHLVEAAPSSRRVINLRGLLEEELPLVGSLYSDDVADFLKGTVSQGWQPIGNDDPPMRIARGDLYKLLAATAAIAAILGALSSYSIGFTHGARAEQRAQVATVER